MILDKTAKKVTRFLDDDGKFHIHTQADVTSTVEHATYLRNTGQHQNSIGDRHLARIPWVVLNAWAEKRKMTTDQVLNDEKLLDRFLRDPDNAHFLVGKL